MVVMGEATRRGVQCEDGKVEPYLVGTDIMDV